MITERMIFMDKRENAVAYKHNGCNCCQAVLAAYSNETGMSEDMVRKLGAGFGAGMGGMEGTCGALCGAEMVLGLKAGGSVSRQAKELYTSFKEKCGATICRELKQRTADGKPLCDCDDCVRNAVAAVEERLEAARAQ